MVLISELNHERYTAKGSRAHFCQQALGSNDSSEQNSSEQGIKVFPDGEPKSTSVLINAALESGLELRHCGEHTPLLINDGPQTKNHHQNAFMLLLLRFEAVC